MVKYQHRFRALLLQLEFDYGVNAFLPIRSTPCLYNALVRYEFNMTSNDHASETREPTTFFCVDISWRTAGSLTKLFAADKDFVDTLWTGFKCNALINTRAHRLRT